jgi:hypothetical protein
MPDAQIKKEQLKSETQQRNRDLHSNLAKQAYHNKLSLGLIRFLQKNCIGRQRIGANYTNICYCTQRFLYHLEFCDLLMALKVKQKSCRSVESSCFPKQALHDKKNNRRERMAQSSSLPTIHDIHDAKSKFLQEQFRA